MKKKSLNLALLVILISAVPLIPAARAEEQSSSSVPVKYGSAQGLLEGMERTYGELDTLQAELNMVDTDPESPPMKLKLYAFSKKERILRVEFLSPPSMKGQFFLAKEDKLYQYIPADRTVIVNNISQMSEARMPDYLSSMNLAPTELTQVLNSEKLNVELVKTPKNPYLSELDQLDFFPEKNPKKTKEKKDRRTDLRGLSSVKSLLKKGFYVLEIKPKTEKAGFARQLLSIDAETLLPRLMITYRKENNGANYLTAVEEIEKNPDLKKKEIVKLPPKSEANYIRP